MGVEKVHVIQVVDILGLQVYLGVVLVLCSLHTHTRIILEHLSGGASMKRIKKKEERKRRGEKTREEKKRGRNKRDERKKKMLHRKSNPGPSWWLVKALTFSYRPRVVRQYNNWQISIVMK